MKCFSTKAAPRAAAAIGTAVPVVWSERPTGTPNARPHRLHRAQVGLLRRSGVDRRALHQPDRRSARLAGGCERLLDLAEDRHPGRDQQRAAARGGDPRISGRSTISKEAIFNTGTSSASSSATASWSNGVEKKWMPAAPRRSRRARPATRGAARCPRGARTATCR